MAKTVFVDTAFLVALLDPRDALNTKAVKLAKKLALERTRMLTSDAVILELANYFARGPLRNEVITWIDTLRASEGWEIVSLSTSTMLAGEARYREHTDKSWSMTDCICMDLMRERNVSDVATSDRGFAQAGFEILLKLR